MSAAVLTTMPLLLLVPSSDVTPTSVAAAVVVGVAPTSLSYGTTTRSGSMAGRPVSLTIDLCGGDTGTGAKDKMLSRL